MENFNDESQGLLLEDNFNEEEICLGNGNNEGRIIGEHCHDNLLSVRNQDKSGAEKTLVIVAIFCLLFIIVQFTGGILANSIAIITDAGHMISDLFSIIVSIIMLRLSKAPANRQFSFGYLRAEFIGALISVFILWVITILMVIFATQRIISKTIEVEPNFMMLTSLVGIAFNLFMGAILKCSNKISLPGHGHSHQHQHSGENVNLRAAFVHVLGDFIQSIGVLIASIIIKYTGFNMADPLCTYLFSFVVVCTSIPVACDIFKIFMEATPKAVSYADIQNDLSKFDGVTRLHNLNIWTLGTNHPAISVHLVIDNPEKAILITKSANDLLKKKHCFTYVTVQTELSDPIQINCNYCTPLSH